MTDCSKIPTLEDIEDSKKAMDDIQSFTYLEDDTFIDAKNVIRDTVNGRLKKMGFAVPISYTAGISFTVNDNIKTVDEGSVVYAPLPSALPFTTSGTWVGDDDARFFTVQGTDQDRNFTASKTLNEAVLDSSAYVGKVVFISDRSNGKFRYITPVTNNGYNKINATGPVLTLQLIDEESVIYPSHWGLVNGLVDINLFLAIQAESNSSGRDVDYGVVDLDFNGQDLSNGGLSPGQDVGSMRRLGVFGRTIFRNMGTSHHTGVLKSRYITYIDCAQPTYCTGIITDVDIAWNEYDGVKRAIYHNDSSVNARLDRALIEKNLFHNHQEDDFLGCILFHRAPETRNVTIQHNEFKGIKTDPLGSNIVLVCQVGVDTSTAITDYSNNKFNHNHVHDCGNPATTYPGSPSFSCVIIGKVNEQNNNLVENNFWMEGPYTKGNENSQDNNVLDENQFCGLSQKVVAVTNESDNNTQNFNIVKGRCEKRAGLRPFGSCRSEGNQVNIYSTHPDQGGQEDSQGGFSLQITRSTTTEGEAYISGNLKARKGIRINTAGKVTIDKINLTSEVGGIEITESIDGPLTSVTMSGEVKCIGRAFPITPTPEIPTPEATEPAINVNWCQEFNIDGSLDVKSNRQDGQSVSLYTQKKTKLNGLSLHLTDLQSDGLTVSSPIGLSVKDGQPVSQLHHLTSIDNLTFITDRNFTNLATYNVDAGWLNPAIANDGGKLKISDSDIDMNGKTGTNLVKTNNNMKKFAIQDVDIDGTLVRVLDAGGKNIAKVLANQNDLTLSGGDADTVGGITNGTVTTSRTVNNKTSP